MDNLKIIKPGETGYGYLIENDGFISPKDERNIPFINEVNKIGNSGTDFKIVEPLKVIAILQKYGVENANGRIYPKPILIAQAKAYQDLIDNQVSTGEVDHPETSIISVNNVGHRITKIWWEGHTLLGEVEILMSPGFIKYGVVSTSGDKVANLLRLGVRIGVSSRGVGSLQEIDGKYIVQDDFEIICWDIVMTPSTPGSWIVPNTQAAQQFTESKTKSNKKLLIDELDKFLI